MATLGDLQVGQAFLLVPRVTARSQQGLALDLYTTTAAAQGSMTIAAADGTIAGALTAVPAASTPVTPVTRWSVVVAGDVLQWDMTGETMVVRAVDIAADGSLLWYSSQLREVAYPLAGWTQIGHVNL